MIRGGDRRKNEILREKVEGMKARSIMEGEPEWEKRVGSMKTWRREKESAIDFKSKISGDNGMVNVKVTNKDGIGESGASKARQEERKYQGGMGGGGGSRKFQHRENVYGT